MAKINGPLFSIAARGTIAGALTYSKRKSGQQTRYQKKQKDVITPARTAHRAIFQEAKTYWQTLSDNEKAQWEQFINQ